MEPKCCMIAQQDSQCHGGALVSMFHAVGTCLVYLSSIQKYSTNGKPGFYIGDVIISNKIVVASQIWPAITDVTPPDENTKLIAGSQKFL